MTKQSKLLVPGNHQREQTEVNKARIFFITVVPTKSDSDVMFCLQSYQGLIINKSLVH